jgi:hypothetical protein
MKTFTIRGASLSCIALAAMTLASVSLAADGKATSNAQARYQKERAACMSGKTNQDRETCLKEAGAALEEAKKGNLKKGTDSTAQNRFRRCDPLPPADREDCIRRMSGEGTVSGSVESGGIYRELKTPVTKP